MRDAFVLVIALLGAVRMNAGVTTIWFSDASQVRTLRGSGVNITTGVASTPWPVQDGQIVWRAVADETDNIGMRHVFYQQYFLDTANVLTPLAGAQIGVHFDKTGKLTFVGGSQFNTFTLKNSLQLQRSALRAVARTLLSNVPGFHLRPLLSETPEEIAALDEETRLLLTTDGVSDGFRYVWTILERDATYETYTVDIDGDTGALLRVATRFGTDNCSPSNPTVQYSATGIPIRPDVAANGVVRYLAVSPASDRPAPFAYDAHIQPGYETPAVEGIRSPQIRRLRASLNIVPTIRSSR